MKRSIGLIVVLLGFFLFTIPLLGADISIEKAVQTANQEIGWEHFKLDKVNKDIWDKYEVLVYGSPETVPAKDQDKTNGEYRYLGYTPLGELMPNPNFPPDDPASTVINNWSWIKEPWTVEALNVRKILSWDNLQENEPYIKEALDEKYGSLFQYNTAPKNAENWYQVTKVLQPRTSVTPGLGRLWHNWNGSYWYITVIIPCEITDIEVTNITNTNPVQPDTDQTANATFRNNGDKEATFEAQYYMNETLIKNENITLNPGGSINKSFEWKAPGKPQQVTLKAYAVPIPEERRTDNNQKTCTIDVITIKPPQSLPCQEKPSVSNSWDELYTWQVHHSDTCIDEKGEEYDCSWTETLWATPEYTETLSATVSINTKQGIPTDRNNPKPSDRESRGSWEIIPWSYKNGLNPNEVTRAGYGFEVTVKTTYTNDWETKVPSGASPHGGTYKGPNKVIADFYDTKGNFVQRIELVPTKGKAGDNNITWELPMKSSRLPDGTYIYERKHYTDVKIPDGRYWVKVTVSEAGKTDLCLIQKEYVTIYGDMYDDIYTRPSSENE